MTQTIQSAIDAVLNAAQVPPLPRTADTFKAGDPQAPLRGVVTTFLATADLVRQTAALGANLIITHEPTYYSAEDTDDVGWLGDDPTFLAKRRLIEEHGIVIWRFHDYWHMMRPDGILTGAARQLGWTLDAPTSVADSVKMVAMTTGGPWDSKAAGAATSAADVPPTTLAELARQVKAQLGAVSVRTVGPDDLPVRRVGLALGALPGRMTIAALQRSDIDAVICGETREWETCEYLRDAAYFGHPKGMLVVGHAVSEEPGMAYLAEWLRPLLPGVTVTHLASGDPFRVY